MQQSSSHVSGVCSVTGGVAHTCTCRMCHAQACPRKLLRAINIFHSPSQRSSSSSSNSRNDPVCEWGACSCWEAGTSKGFTRRGSISQQESHPGSLFSKNQLVNSLERPVHICNTQQLMRSWSCTYKITISSLFIYVTDYALCEDLKREI